MVMPKVPNLFGGMEPAKTILCFMVQSKSGFFSSPGYFAPLHVLVSP